MVKSLECQIKKIGFTWIDKTGIIVLKQNGIIRTNCIDCLDRTNVVQGAISQTICINQCRKLGLIEPLNKAPEKIADLLNEMWATHGDTISRQYAGTNALKGDITRNPNLRRRKFTGIMKDGFNSASRYYMSHFSDSRKQSIIDILLTN